MVMQVLQRLLPGARSRQKTTSTIRQPITFFCYTETEDQNIRPLRREAERRGIGTRITRDMAEPARIGIYGSHHPDPKASDFSVALLHDVGQEYWPDEQTLALNFWHESPWDNFDIGVLPGPVWSRCWQRCSSLPITRPRIGVFELGWPKADYVFNDRAGFARVVAELRQSTQIQERPTVLLAPSWDTEDSGRFHDFVGALGALPVNLLVKYWPEHELIRHEMIQPYRGTARNVTIVDPKTNIIDCLGLVDIIVSDESNCLAEALLFDIPGIAVTDWKIPALPHMGLPERPCEPPYYAEKVALADLRTTVERMLADPRRYRRRAQRYRKEQFSHLGRSSALILDVIEAALAGRPFPVPRIAPLT